MLIYRHEGKSIGLIPVITEYAHGNNLAILLETVDGDAYADLTTNLPDLPGSGLAADEGFVKMDSFHFADWICELGLAEKTGRSVRHGYNEYELLRFHLEKLKDQESIE